MALYMKCEGFVSIRTALARNIVTTLGSLRHTLKVISTFIAGIAVLKRSKSNIFLVQFLIS